MREQLSTFHKTRRSQIVLMLDPHSRTVHVGEACPASEVRTQQLIRPSPPRVPRRMYRSPVPAWSNELSCPH